MKIVVILSEYICKYISTAYNIVNAKTNHLLFMVFQTLGGKFHRILFPDL